MGDGNLFCTWVICFVLFCRGVVQRVVESVLSCGKSGQFFCFVESVVVEVELLESVVCRSWVVGKCCLQESSGHFCCWVVESVVAEVELLELLSCGNAL